MTSETMESSEDKGFGKAEPVVLEIPSGSEYVLLARLVVSCAGQIAGFGPEDVYDLKLAVTEAVTNVIGLVPDRVQGPSRGGGGDGNRRGRRLRRRGAVFQPRRARRLRPGRDPQPRGRGRPGIHRGRHAPTNAPARCPGLTTGPEASDDARRLPWSYAVSSLAGNTRRGFPPTLRVLPRALRGV